MYDDRRRLTLVALLVIVANCIDLATTYHVSPDLANEWNILHRQFGLGWAGLIGAKLIGGALAIVGYSYYLRHRTACYPAPGADRSTFYRHLSFGEAVSWFEMQYRPPATRHLLMNLAYFWAGMQLLLLWVALDNYLLSFGFSWPIRNVSEMGYHVMQGLLVATVVMVRFYTSNYRRYLGLPQHAVAAAPVRVQSPV